MVVEGVLKKMIIENRSPINYFLDLKTHTIHVNQFIGKTIHFKHIGFECLNCYEDKPIFRQGFCKKCFFETPTAGDWIMRPELSRAHIGIEDRNLEYEKKVQLQSHVVYLASSSHLKVGVTRESQIPTRWIDQGAEHAVPLAIVPNRYLAGITEVALKDHVVDKTNWRKMLTSKAPEIDILAKKEELKKYLPSEVQEFYVENPTEYHFDFPIDRYSEKVTSINLAKLPEFEKVLKGIKGQYLLFEDQTVFNIRSNEGYYVELKV
ncbi:MAG: DUF2797 domain-containing protein [Flavobacteriales bacterium]